MKNKGILFLLMLALVLSLFAGCGKKETDPTENTKADGTKASDESTEEASDFVPDYSAFLDDYGYIEGLTASDYAKDVDFSKIEIPTKTMKETAEMYVDYCLSGLTAGLGTEVTDRAIENGDKVNIDYSGSMDGEVFEGGTAQGAEVTAGSNEFIDDFLTQIIGHKPGDFFDVEVTFPDPYPNNQAFAGKDATFAVKINFIVEYPEVDDAFVEAHPDEIASIIGNATFKTAAELKERLYKDYFDYQLETEINTALKAMEGIDTIPEEAMNYAKNSMDCSYYAQYQVTTEALISAGYTEEEVQKMIAEEAKVELLLQVICEQQGWKVEESEFAETIGSQYGEEMKKTYGTGYLARYVMFERSLAYLKETVTLTD